MGSRAETANVAETPAGQAEVQKPSLMRASEALRSIASARAWQIVFAALASGLLAATLNGGLVFWFPWAQVGLVAGIAVGLMTRSRGDAAVAAAAGVGLGALLGPSNSLFLIATEVRVAQGVLSVLLAAGVAFGVRALAGRVAWLGRVAFWAAVLVIVSNLWLTSLTLSQRETTDPTTGLRLPSLASQLQEEALPPDFEDDDNVLFMRVYKQVKAGVPYYSAFGELFVSWSGGREPTSVTNVRSPYLFFLWAALPTPQWVLWTFLALASVAVVSVVPMVRGFVRLPVALPAVAALSAYFMAFSIKLPLFTAEVWGVAVALVSFAAWAVSMHSDRWRLFAVAAVALAVVAALFRETLVFVPLAGAVAAVFAPGPQRKFRVIAWAVGLAAIGTSYALHYWMARSIVDPSSTYSQFLPGGPLRVFQAIVFGTDHLGSGGWFALLLAALGLAGAGLIPDRSLKLFAVTSIVVPLTAFLFIGNTAVDNFGTPKNYWGAAVVPLLYACIPFALAVMPGALVSGSTRVSPDAGAVDTLPDRDSGDESDFGEEPGYGAR